MRIGGLFQFIAIRMQFASNYAIIRFGRNYAKNYASIICQGLGANQQTEPSKLEGCWFAPWRSVGARCQVAECLSTPCQFCAILSHSLTV